MIRKLTAYKIGQAVRDDGPQTHLVKTRHADHGRRADPGVGGGHHAAVGGPRRTATCGSAAHHARLRRRRLGRRLAQGRAPQPQGAVGAREVLLAVGDRTRAAVSILACSAKLPAQTEFIVPFFKTVAIPLGAIGFVILSYFVIVGTTNAVNLTDGLDGLAIMPTVMIAAALAVFAYVTGHAVFSKYLGFPLISGRRRAHRVLRRHRRARGSRSSGSTPTRRRCSWATWARSRWARRSAWWRSGPAGDRAVHHGRRVRGGDAVGDDPGGAPSSSPASASSAWRRCTTTTS